MSPEDVECEGFDVTYTRIASDSNKSSQHHHHRASGSAGGAIPPPLENDIHVKVENAIESFLKNLSQIGPELLSVSADPY